MGDRGHTLHVLDGDAAAALAKSGLGRIAMLGRNARWTSFVPLDLSSFDGERVSEVVARVLLHIWFDDDLGIVLQVYDGGVFVGELALPPTDGVSDADRAFLGTLEALGVVTRKAGRALLDRLDGGDDLLAWVMRHGVEKLLGVPYHDALPPDVSEATLRELLPRDAIILEPQQAPKATARARRTPAAAASRAQKTSWTDEERATVDRHVVYWAELWSMNGWKLYNRYKKHLPANQRRDVDRLCTAVAVDGDAGVIREQVTSILARIWDREDWEKIIRDPKLAED